MTFSSRLRDGAVRVWSNRGKLAGSLVVRATVSVGLLAFLLSGLDWQSLGSVINRISLREVLIFSLVSTTSWLFHAWKWRVLLRSWRITLPFSALFKWVLVGMFFSNFLPGGLGSDAARLHTSGRSSGQVLDSLAAILYDRLFNLAALLVLGMGALFAWGGDATQNTALWIFFGCVLLAIITFAALAGSPWSTGLMAQLSQKVEFLGLLHVAKMFESMRLKSNQSRLLIFAFVLTVAMEILDVLTYYIVAIALDLPVTMLDLFVLVPLLYLATATPISINGIGVREGASILFFSRLGISQAESVSFSLSYFALVLLLSMAGGLIYLVDGSSLKRVQDSR